MDASKITEMRQKQSNIFINRAQVVDSSTLTWNRMIQSSKYVATQAPVTNYAGCTTCGGMSQISVGTAGVGPGAFSTPGFPGLTVNPPPLQPNPLFNNKGSGSFVYSSESITLQRAGYATCGVATVNQQQYITLPRCFCAADIFYQDGDKSKLIVPPGADISGSWLNPYLPIPQPYATLGLPQNNPGGLYKVRLNNGNWGYSPSYVAPNVARVLVKDLSGNIVTDSNGNPVFVIDCESCVPRATDVSQLT
jgi:hypothetical protein